MSTALAPRALDSQSPGTRLCGSSGSSRASSRLRLGGDTHWGRLKLRTLPAQLAAVAAPDDGPKLAGAGVRQGLTSRQGQPRARLGGKGSACRRLHAPD